jgi:dsDNA-binding SOS-regulon protein
MRNLLAFTTEPSTATQTVVINDTPQSISDALAKAIQAANDGANKAGFILERLEAERENWERTELAASHRRLYGTLTGCYSYYLTMKTDTSTNVRSEHKKALDTFAELRKYQFQSNSHDMTRVVKSVFGGDRRRNSAYSLALRAALVAGGTDSDGKSVPVPAADLADWLEQQGGIEEIRLGSKNKGMTVKERANVAKTAIQSSVLMTLKPDVKHVQFDTNDVDKMMVLVATYRPSGELEISAVVKNDSAVRSALACYFTANKDDVTKAANSAKPSTPSVSATQLALEQTQSISAE